MAGQMAGGAKRVPQCMQVFIVRLRDVGQRHATIGGGLLPALLTAVDAHMVAARSQARARLLHAGLKPAVPGGDTSCA